MKKIIENLKKRKKEITIIAIILFIIILFFSGYSMGKGFSSTSINGETGVAEPIIVVENNPPVSLKTTNDKGYYEFSVKNYDQEGNLTQVDLSYNIEILSKLDKSIVVKIYKENEEIKLENNKTENMLLTNEQKQEDKYKMEITYDKTASTSLEDIIQDIQIKVHSEQVKL